METLIKQESAGAINGVPGRFGNVILWPQTGKIANQKWISERRDYRDGKNARALRVNIRHDDCCKNGHESFAITATGYRKAAERYIEDSGGCLHDEIEKVFPELAPLIKWHLCSTDGPLHYVANTVYHASDRDHNGLLKGEARQIRNGRTGELCWTLEAINAPGIGISTTETGLEYQGAATVPLYLLTKECYGETPRLATPKLQWVPWCRVGEGKAREFDSARRSAVWPEATDAELSVSKEDLKAKLLQRLPGLIAAMRADIEAIGMLWENPNPAVQE